MSQDAISRGINALEDAVAQPLLARIRDLEAALAQEKLAARLNAEGETRRMREMEDALEAEAEARREAEEEVVRLREALRWYVENDDTNHSDPGNQFWIDGYQRAKALLEASDPASRTEI